MDYVDKAVADLEAEIDLLRAANVRLEAIETAAVVLLENNGGPTGGDSYEGGVEYPDTHMLTRIDDFKALERAVKA